MRLVKFEIYRNGEPEKDKDVLWINPDHVLWVAAQEMFSDAKRRYTEIATVAWNDQLREFSCICVYGSVEEVVSKLTGTFHAQS